MDRRKSTGELVPHEGLYVCEAGEKRMYRIGENFDVCPITEKHTKWRKLNEKK